MNAPRQGYEKVYRKGEANQSVDFSQEHKNCIDLPANYVPLNSKLIFAFKCPRFIPTQRGLFNHLSATFFQGKTGVVNV